MKHQKNIFCGGLKNAEIIDILIKLKKRYPEIVKECIKFRPLLKLIATSDMEVLNKALYNEKELESRKDEEYWAPLRKELEALLHKL